MTAVAAGMLRASLVLTVLVTPITGLGQYREYYVTGRIVDTQQKLLEGVEVSLRDARTGRVYSLTTKKDGAFKFAGLPHAVYKVWFEKKGYASKEVEWNFEKPQDAMVKVDIPPITLATLEGVLEGQRLKEAESAGKAAAEKIRLGEYDAAISELTTILKKNPKDANALYLLGMAYLKKKKWAEAAVPFSTLARLSPAFAAVYYQLGICYQQQKEPEKALEQYRKAMELDPANPDCPFNSALILFELNRVDEALVLFEKALALKPDDPAALEMAGRCCIHQSKFEKAIDYLEKARSGYAADTDKVMFLDGLIAKAKEQIKK